LKPDHTPAVPGSYRSAVIFDFDGVLIDSEGLQYQAYSMVLERFQVCVSREEYAAHWIAAGRGPEYAVRTYHLPVTPAQLRALKQPLYHDLLRQHVELMPGVQAALRRLLPHHALGIATNSNQEDVNYVLRRFGLDGYFRAVVTREAYTSAKPEPDAYLIAAERLGFAPAQCVVIEDAERGVIAAHRAGARPVAVPNPFTASNDFSLARRIVTSLDEVTLELISAVLTEDERPH